jgi:hypothetical protein
MRSQKVLLTQIPKVATPLSVVAPTKPYDADKCLEAGVNIVGGVAVMAANVATGIGIMNNSENISKKVEYLTAIGNGFGTGIGASAMINGLSELSACRPIPKKPDDNP